MINVQIPADYASRLNTASAKKRCYPWDKNVIDWSIPIDDSYLYVPQKLSFAYDTPAWDRMTFEEKSFVTRYEFTQNMRNAGAGEHLLMQAILAVLHHTDQYNPAWRFMLHEVAEECQHMGMFNEWIRLNPDIRTKGLKDDSWGLFASMMTPLLATKLPMMFWSLTLILELVGDSLAKTQKDEDLSNVHPIVKQISQAHETEEARHIAFAREWLREGMPKMGAVNRRSLAWIVETVARAVLKIGLNVPYSKQIAPYITFEEYKQGIRSEHRNKILQEALLPTVDIMLSLGIIRKKAVREWNSSGLLMMDV